MTDRERLEELGDTFSRIKVPMEQCLISLEQFLISKDGMDFAIARQAIRLVTYGINDAFSLLPEDIQEKLFIGG